MLPPFFTTNAPTFTNASQVVHLQEVGRQPLPLTALRGVYDGGHDLPTGSNTDRRSCPPAHIFSGIAPNSFSSSHHAGVYGVPRPTFGLVFAVSRGSQLPLAHRFRLSECVVRCLEHKGVADIQASGTSPEVQHPRAGRDWALAATCMRIGLPEQECGCAKAAGHRYHKYARVS